MHVHASYFNVSLKDVLVEGLILILKTAKQLRMTISMMSSRMLTKTTTERTYLLTDLRSMYYQLRLVIPT